MSNKLSTSVKNKLIATFAERYEFEEHQVSDVLKSTAFRQTGGNEISDAQMIALIVVANRYDLNPFTKEIYAFPSRGGIVPIVSIDGWLKMINSHPDFNGMDIENEFLDGKLISVTCSIYRKSRDRATIIPEFMQECYRNTDPWKKHPIRMLRHKSVIQCARYAFSFSGIYDQDEGERILESVEIENSTTKVDEVEIPTNEDAMSDLPEYSQEKFELNYPKWEKAVNFGNLTKQDIIDKVCTTYMFTQQQSAMIYKLGE